MFAEVWPQWETTLGALPDKLALLSAVLTRVPLTPYVPVPRRRGRPPQARAPLAAAFVAKAIYNYAQTRQLLDRLQVDDALRQVCGFASRADVPSEATFSRAFAQFAQSRLPEHLHASLMQSTQRERLIGHLSRDATAIEARECIAPCARPKDRNRRAKPRSGPSGPKRRHASPASSASANKRWSRC